MALNSQLLTVQILTNDVQELILCLYILLLLYESLSFENLLTFFKETLASLAVHSSESEKKRKASGDHQIHQTKKRRKSPEHT